MWKKIVAAFANKWVVIGALVVVLGVTGAVVGVVKSNKAADDNVVPVVEQIDTKNSEAGDSADEETVESIELPIITEDGDIEDIFGGDTDTGSSSSTSNSGANYQGQDADVLPVDSATTNQTPAVEEKKKVVANTDSSSSSSDSDSSSSTGSSNSDSSSSGKTDSSSSPATTVPDVSDDRGNDDLPSSYDASEGRVYETVRIPIN